MSLIVGKLSKKIAYFPIKLFLGFLIFTELLFFLGPVQYDVPNSLGLALYLALVNYALFLGYRTGIRNYNYGKLPSRLNYDRALKFILLFSVCMLIPKMISSWNVSSISPSLIVNKMIDGITSSAEIYYAKADRTVGMLEYVLMITDAITFMAIPLGVYNWKKLSTFYRVLLIFIVIFEIIIWLGMGTRKGIVDTMLIVVLLVASLRTSLISNPWKNKRLLIFIGGCFLVFIIYFITSYLSRYNVENIASLVDKSHNVIKPYYQAHFPIEFSMFLSSIEDYLCFGYYSLGQALATPETMFSYGLGNSWFTINIAEKLNFDVLPMTYQGLLERTAGISATQQWHTIYVWLANDLTFWGVPFIIFIIGKYYARSWIETVTARDFFAPAVFALFSLMIFYFFANNQILSFSFIPFVVLLFLWKYKFRIGS